MSRLLLLALDDTEVDVLTRVRDLSSDAEVLVVHPDSASLVIRLARLAGYPATAEVPAPRVEDVVIASAGRSGSLAEPWREAGAPVLAPGEFNRDSWESARRAAARARVPSPPRETTPPAPGEPATPRPLGPPSPPPPIRFVSPDDEEEEIPLPRSLAPNEPLRATTPPEAPAKPVPSAAPMPPAAPAPAPASAPAPPASVAAPVPVGDPGWDIFASPEATFTYLAHRALGPEGTAVLWWDGAMGAWSPWCVVGDPGGEGLPMEPGDGRDLETRWGRFRLVADQAGNDSLWNPQALRRVAEDLALRDLMEWREELRRLEGLSLAGPGGTPEETDRWFRPFTDILRPSAVFLWRGETDGWSLVGARGAGITYAGRLVMPGSMLGATFDRPELWRRWDPAAGLRAYCQFEEGDRRWPLRLARVRDVLKGRGPSR